MTQIQAASISAIPQQADRETRPSAVAATSNPTRTELKTNDILEKSVETGDRDAQEQYQGKAPDAPKTEQSHANSSQPVADESNSIWSLAVADDQPLPDLDIRG